MWRFERPPGHAVLRTLQKLNIYFPETREKDIFLCTHTDSVMEKAYGLFGEISVVRAGANALKLQGGIFPFI